MTAELYSFCQWLAEEFRKEQEKDETEKRNADATASA